MCMVLVVFSPYKMAPHFLATFLSSSIHFFSIYFISKPIVIWKTRGNCHHFHEHVFLPKNRRDEVQGGKVWSPHVIPSEIGIRRFVVPKEEAETEQTLPLLVGHWGKTPTAPVVGMLYPTLYCTLIFITAKKIKTYHRFLIMSCHSSTKSDIMMISSKHKLDIITKTVYVSLLHSVLILYF